MNAHSAIDERELPENLEAEKQLLGAILMNNDAYERVSQFLEPFHFRDPLHRDLYSLFADRILGGHLVNPTTLKGYAPLTSVMNEEEVTEGEQPFTLAMYLVQLAADAAFIAGARDYGLAIFEMFLRRQMIELAEDLKDLANNLAPDDDILDRIADIENRLFEIRAERVKEERNKKAGTRYLERLTAANQRDELSGVPIMKELQTVLSEPVLEGGNLYGLLASSGEGKTSLVLQIVTGAIKHGHPVLFMSYDQSESQCIGQMCAQIYGIELRRQRTPKLLSDEEWSNLGKFGDWIDKQTIEFKDCTNESAVQLCGYARQFIKRSGNGKTPLIIVDHIGVVKPEDSRADEGTKAKQINQKFKAAAKETGAAFFILNQRNSFGMRRDNPRPVSADLFGGDPAKQAYDGILYLYRFLKFYEEKKAIAGSNQDHSKLVKNFPENVRNGSEDIAEIGAIKVRFGSPNIKERMLFDAPFTRYKPLEKAQEVLL